MYEWVTALHILAVISWMAGLLYLPRLLVYHVAAERGSVQDDTFQTMERRLLMAIMRPAALVVFVSGFALIHLAGYSFGEVWLAVKLLAVVGLFGVHGVLEAHVGQFRRGECRRSSRYFRVLNEVPTLLMIVVVIMVVVKPFS
jgi:protoporphyrinogen IX oxidase